MAVGILVNASSNNSHQSITNFFVLSQKPRKHILVPMYLGVSFHKYASRSPLWRWTVNALPCEFTRCSLVVYQAITRTNDDSSKLFRWINMGTISQVLVYFIPDMVTILRTTRGQLFH